MGSINDKIKITGELRLRIYDRDGKLKSEMVTNNMIVTTGKAHIASLLQNASGPTQMGYMGLGTGTSGPSAGDTDLGSEITTGLGGNRKATTKTNPTSVTVKYSTTWDPGEATNAAITEAIIVNAQAVGPASGTLLARSVFTAQPKASGDTLKIDWTITIS